MSKSLKDICEDTKKEWKEMNKTVQDLKVEIHSRKKTQTERNMEMKYWDRDFL